MNVIIPSNCSVFKLGMRVRLRTLMERSPRLYIALEKWKNGEASNAVSPGDDVVIEGFPRSANSFCVRAFRRAQEDEPSVADHLHSPVNVIMALRWNIPVMVLIRDPEEAVVSQLALAFQASVKDEEPILQGSMADQDYVFLLDLFTRRYVNFYESLVPYLDRICVVLFRDAVEDFGDQMARFNRRFGTDFSLFDHTVENVQAIFDGAGFHLSPARDREALKRDIRGYLDRVDEEFLGRARELYDRFRSARDGS